MRCNHRASFWSIGGYKQAQAWESAICYYSKRGGRPCVEQQVREEEGQKRRKVPALLLDCVSGGNFSCGCEHIPATIWCITLICVRGLHRGLSHLGSNLPNQHQLVATSQRYPVTHTHPLFFKVASPHISADSQC
jgi:hypothetical protein